MQRALSNDSRSTHPIVLQKWRQQKRRESTTWTIEDQPQKKIVGCKSSVSESTSESPVPALHP